MAQFHHKSWTLADGMPAIVYAIAQTPDGFLWLGSDQGLFRFDGIRAEAFGDGQLPATEVSSLATGHDGSLWIGFGAAKIARVRAGKVETFDVPTSGLRTPVMFLAKDRDGSMWVGTRDRVLGFDGQRWRAIDSPWPAAATWSNPGGIWGLAAGRDGTVWSKNLLGLYCLRRGETVFEAVPGYGAGLIDFARDTDGRLWTADFSTRRFYALPDLEPGRPIPPPEYAAPVPPPFVGAVRMDRDGTVWNANRITGGFYRTATVRRPAAAERFTMQQGLLSDTPSFVFEDREGNIWVGSAGGLERFSHANIVAERDLPLRHQAPALVATEGALFYYSGMGARVPDPADQGRRLFRIAPGQSPTLLAADIGQLEGLGATADGAVVFASGGKLKRWQGGVATVIEVPPEIDGGHVVNLVVTPGDGLLVSLHGKGVHRLTGGRWTRIVPPSAQAGDSARVALDAVGAAWLLYESSDLIATADGDRVAEFRSRVGRIRATLADREGIILLGTRGLARYDGRALQFIHASHAPVLKMGFGIVKTRDDDIWIGTQAGLLQIDRAALLGAFADPEAPFDYRLFDSSDGFTGMPPGETFLHSMAIAPDGRIWFLQNTHVSWIHPDRLYRNPQPPPVVITSIAADARAQEAVPGLSLPAGTSRLQIDFTGLSLATPERVRFRYRLSGEDQDWIDAGGQRQAVYTSVKPGSHRFQVIAANADGVWNTTGVTLDFTVLPTFRQTWTFKTLVALAASVTLWLLYRLRLRQVSERVRARLAERMDERERIARELHDTLLQAVQGLILKVDGATRTMAGDDPVRLRIMETLDGAEQLVSEGRDRVRSLRTGATLADLPSALEHVARERASSGTAQVRSIVEGRSRPLDPIVMEEALAIGREALVNALTHSGATHVELETAYDARQLRLRIRDDGCGIGPDILGSGRSGHWGIQGMRERALRIGARLEIWSRPGAGTEVDLTVPAATAYRDQ